jgi:hypothetical protein
VVVRATTTPVDDDRADGDPGLAGFPSPFATVVRLRSEFERHPPFTMVVYDHRLAHLGTLSPSSPRGRFESLEPWLHRLHKMLNLAPAPTNPRANRNGLSPRPRPGNREIT